MSSRFSQHFQPSRCRQKSASLFLLVFHNDGTITELLQTAVMRYRLNQTSFAFSELFLEESTRLPPFSCPAYICGIVISPNLIFDTVVPQTQSIMHCVCTVCANSWASDPVHPHRAHCAHACSEGGICGAPVYILLPEEKNRLDI